jgi:hypothetical protein
MRAIPRRSAADSGREDFGGLEVDEAERPGVLLDSTLIWTIAELVAFLTAVPRHSHKSVEVHAGQHWMWVASVLQRLNGK